jgi:hypothetical protein
MEMYSIFQRLLLKFNMHDLSNWEKKNVEIIYFLKAILKKWMIHELNLYFHSN